MIYSKDEIVISLSDFLRAIKRGQWTLFIAAALCALLFFFWQVKKPIHYTAKGIFKNSSTSPAARLPSFLKIVEFPSLLNESEENLATLFKSLPLLKKVVEKQNLQAALYGYEKKGSLQKLRETLQAEKSYFTFKRLKRPSSPILSGDVIVPDSLPFRDPAPPIACIDISYPQEIYTILKLRFHNAKTFTVINPHGKIIGEGELGKPFLWEQGRFTLKNCGGATKKIPTLQLTLIPLEKAALGLQAALTVKKDKENPSLFHVSYTHDNRQLAAAIVNGVMEEYCGYIRNEAEKKISHQLSYLSAHQNRSQAEYEKSLDAHCKTLEKIVGEGGFLSLEKEIEFLTKTQVDYLKELNRLHSEIEYLSATLQGLPQKPKTVEVFTIDAAEELLASYQEESDKLDFERAQYNHSLKKLSDPDAEIGALTKTIQDPDLQEIFTKVYTLNRKLADEKNWSRGEQEHLREELETEKKFLSFQLKNLIEGVDLQENVLQDKILSLKQLMLSLLKDEYKITEKNLRDLSCKASSLPEKWIAEKKQTLSLTLQKEFTESLAKLIESRNISYNLENLTATPFFLASLPSLPDNPKLFFFTHIGAFAGFFCALCFLFFRTVAKGPTASAKNIAAAGYKLCGVITTAKSGDPALKSAVHEIKPGILFLTARTSLSCTAGLLTLLHKRGESICLITDSEEVEFGLYEYLQEENNLSFGLSSSESEEFAPQILGFSAEVNGQRPFTKPKSTRDASKLPESEGEKPKTQVNKSRMPLIKAETYDYMPWGRTQEFKEQLLQSSSFHKLLKKLKEKYGWIIFETTANIDSIESKILTSQADQILFVVTDEPLKKLSSLPSNTLLLLQPKPFTKKPVSLPRLPLRRLIPLLEPLIPKRFFQRLHKR